MLQCASPITFDDILSFNSKLLVNESLLIKPNKPVLKRKTKSFPLDLSD